MHNFFKEDDPINWAIAIISLVVWIITKNEAYSLITVLLGMVIAQSCISFLNYFNRPLKIRKTTILEQGKCSIGNYTISSTTVLPSAKLQKIIDSQIKQLPQNFKRMFPSLVGFGWNKTWHGDRVAYALEYQPQNILEQAIYDEFHVCLQENTGQAKFIQRLEPILHKIGYNICTKYKVRKNRFIPGGKFVSSRRLKIIYNTNRNIYQNLTDWIKFCNDPDFMSFLLRCKSSDEYLNEGVLPLVHPFWGLYAPPNKWNNFDRLYFHSEIPDNYHDFIIPDLEYVEWVNKKTGEIISIPVGIHPGFQINFYLIYDRLFYNNQLIKNLKLQ